MNNRYKVEVLDPCGLIIEIYENISYKKAMEIIKKARNCILVSLDSGSSTHFIKGQKV